MMTMTTTVSGKMICPNCGAEMNHHCDKLVCGAGPGETREFEDGSGGFFEEFHACPKCGSAASRHAGD